MMEVLGVGPDDMLERGEKLSDMTLGLFLSKCKKKFPE